MKLDIRAIDEINKLNSRVVSTENSSSNTQNSIETIGQAVKILFEQVAELQTQVSNSQGNIEFLQLVTGLTGGGDTNLDGVITWDVSTPRLYFFHHTSGSVLGYLLKDGTDAESSPGIIRPDDYADSENEKIFLAVM